MHGIIFVIHFCFCKLIYSIFYVVISFENNIFENICRKHSSVEFSCVIYNFIFSETYISISFKCHPLAKLANYIKVLSQYLRQNNPSNRAASTQTFKSQNSKQSSACRANLICDSILFRNMEILTRKVDFWMEQSLMCFVLSIRSHEVYFLHLAYFTCSVRKFRKLSIF